MQKQLKRCRSASITRVAPAKSALPDDIPDTTEEKEGDEVEGDAPKDEPLHRELDHRQEEICRAMHQPRSYSRTAGRPSTETVCPQFRK